MVLNCIAYFDASGNDEVVFMVHPLRGVRNRQHKKCEQRWASGKCVYGSDGMVAAAANVLPNGGSFIFTGCNYKSFHFFIPSTANLCPSQAWEALQKKR